MHQQQEQQLLNAFRRLKTAEERTAVLRVITGLAPAATLPRLRLVASGSGLVGAVGGSHEQASAQSVALHVASHQTG
jgi:hypothetical protein